MSIGQLLLTAGVALWVFDSKKIPRLVSDLIRVTATFQHYYQRVSAQWRDLLQEETNQQILARNEKKAKQAEAYSKTDVL